MPINTIYNFLAIWLFARKESIFIPKWWRHPNPPPTMPMRGSSGQMTHRYLANWFLGEWRWPEPCWFIIVNLVLWLYKVDSTCSTCILRCSTVSRFYLFVALLYFWEEMKVPLVNYRVWGETTAIPEVFSAPVIIMIIPVIIMIIVIIPIPQQIFSQNIQHSSHSPAYFMTILLKIQSLINAFCLLRELFLFFTSSGKVNSPKSKDKSKKGRVNNRLSIFRVVYNVLKIMLF